jgi:hypothetical protein
MIFCTSNSDSFFEGACAFLVFLFVENLHFYFKSNATAAKIQCYAYAKGHVNLNTGVGPNTGT